MNSAIGNFNNDGVALNVYPPRTVEWCASKIVALEDEITRLKLTSPVVNNTANVTVDALEYVTQVEWDQLAMLVNLMLANGATLFEVQQRLMGLG